MLTTEEQRQILDAKRRQLAAQAFEHNLNAQLMELQLPMEADTNHRTALEKEIRTSRKNARQLYAGAELCQQKLDELPKEEKPADGEPVPDWAQAAKPKPEDTPAEAKV